MAELGVAASIIAIVQITGTLISYLNDVKDAPKECSNCMIELSHSTTLLLQLRGRVSESKSEDPWYVNVQTLDVENGPLYQYKRSLDDLLEKVKTSSKMRKAVNALLWPWIKEDVARLFAKLERLKSLVSIALELDNFELLEATKDDTISIRKKVDVLADAHSQQQFYDMMAWLSLTDFRTQQDDIISRRQEGTGQWFLDSNEFKKWLQGSKKTLFCPGIPGAGKTMISAIVIDHLRRSTQTEDVGVAFLYCNYKAQADQNVLNLLSALLRQLVQSRPDIAAPVTEIYNTKRRSKPSIDEIFRALQSVCSNYTTVYVVVDALDECTVEEGSRGLLIDKLCDLQSKAEDVQLLFTSRFMPDIARKFESSLTIEVRASEIDVKRYVEGQMPRLPNCIQRDKELKDAIKNKIAEVVDGMFLLARLHVDSFLDKLRKPKVISTLEKLSKGLEALDKAYNEAITRIDEQPAEHRLLAWRALSWITYAQRPLTTRELCLAVSIEPSNKALIDEDAYVVEDIVSACAGLVAVDQESTIIRLVHATTQEYFEQVLSKWNPGAQEEIATACLTYLSFDTFQSGRCESDETFEKRIAENGFFDYSTRHWSEHVRPVQNTISSLALSFLCDDILVDCAIQGALTGSYKYNGYSQRYPGTKGLHLTARCGLLHLTQELLMGKYTGCKVEADSKDGYGQTPLSYAAENGHEGIVKLLLDTGKVDADWKDGDGRTPLWWAAGNGHEAIVKLLQSSPAA